MSYCDGVAGMWPFFIVQRIMSMQVKRSSFNITVEQNNKPHVAKNQPFPR